MHHYLHLLEKILRAIEARSYGPPEVLALVDVPKPTAKDNQVLIRVRAATVTAGDCELRRFDFPIYLWLPVRLFVGLTRPRKKIFGQEFAGEVEAVGKDVKTLKPGDEIFANTGIGFGAWAEYKALPTSGAIALKPANASFEEAACIPTGGQNALHFLRRANITPGKKVLIFGSSGSIGTFAVQIAKHFGAEVTAVCTPSSVALVKSLGADHAIDHTVEDFTKNGQLYDVIFDTIGKSPYPRSKKSLTSNGIYLQANPRFAHMIGALWTAMTSSKKVVVAMAGETTGGLNTLREMFEAGTITSVIDRTYPLEQMADAHRYVELGEKTGHLVISVPQ